MNFNNQIRIIAFLLLLTAISITGKANRGISHPMNGLMATSDSVNIELLHAKRPSVRLCSSTTRDGITFMNLVGDQPLEFFIFDIEGVLIHQTVLNPKEKKTITTLKKGVYLYDLFYKDEGIERGKITIQ
jgi:hypothetical protein